VKDITVLIDNIILSYKDNPIDLLKLGEGKNEYQYLQDLKYSYIRTVKDISSLLPKGAKVLEIGSLFGVVSIALKQSGFDVTGTEIPEFYASENLQKLYQKHGITFDQVNLRDYKLPYPDESFDAVVMCEVLEHLNFNPLPVLQEINRVLKKDGYLYIAMPNQASLDNRLKLLTGKSVHSPIQYYSDQLDAKKNFIVSIHWREYTMTETLDMITKMGFLLQKKYYFSENGPRTRTLFSLFRFLLYLFPPLRSSLVVIAKKDRKSNLNFRFTKSST